MLRDDTSLPYIVPGQLGDVAAPRCGVITAATRPQRDGANDRYGANDRARALQFWTRRARELAPGSLALLERLPPHARAVLFRGRELGQFYHVLLFEELLKSIDYPDAKYAREVLQGLNVAGPVSRYTLD